MLFKICKFGDNQPYAGLTDLPVDHAQMLMMVPIPGNKHPKELKPGESCQCRGRPTSHANNDKHPMSDAFTVVRLE